ncbi:ComEC/Rec2 family competence protein [Paenibacillus woosongensis]|uniref:ComEC/Rec2 family competence protein n=1 Tax=Paenibacillus woosongensis TaxID=307580 RepID=A0AA95HZC3_9BACL|nr:ComEC/Rec2 family competence protein [Paenibacillus woosongensis]WHX47624.1 ComEC/Rec2 family competence protein [Paenibacillus woosongensis]
MFVSILAVVLMLSGCALELEFGSPADTNSGSRLNEGHLRVIFLDVGQGASQLLISPSGKTMLIDAGNNDREQAMLDYLREYGVNRLDIVIGTHPDADHIGGLDRVIDHVDIGEIYMPKIQANTKTFESLLLSIKNKGLKVKTAKAGLVLEWDEDVQVTMVAPVQTYDDKNNMSAVVKVVYGNTSYLLTGDAERQSEKDMIESGADLQADVMLIGHHGSKSSTTLSFLKKAAPQYGVIQVGENNYGHPTSTVLDRLSKQGIEVYRNDLHGTVEIASDGHTYRIATER